MSRRRSRFYLLPVAGLFLVLGGCAMRASEVPQSPFSKLFAGSAGHIAYVGADGNLYVATQSGGIAKLTNDAQSDSGGHVTYVSPTWGPRGRRIAYVRYLVNPANGSSTVQLDVLDWRTKKEVVAFSSNTLKPFYFDWAPDGAQIAVLSEIAGAQEFGVVQADKANSYRRLDTGSPYYWAWTPRGGLVTHSDFSATGGGKLSLFSSADPHEIVHIEQPLGLFQAPAVLPDGRIIAVVGGQGSARLASVDPTTGAAAPLGPADRAGFLFSLSPNGRLLAYLSPRTIEGRPAGVLHVLSMESRKELASLSTLSTVAYYWSPDSSRIALFTPARPQKVGPAFSQVSSLPLLTLEVLDLGSGKIRKVATFPPTQGMVSTLPFTDQYQHSETIWSPNGRYLVFDSYTSRGLPGVFVADASGKVALRKIADGDSAVWSWK